MRILISTLIVRMNFARKEPGYLFGGHGEGKLTFLDHFAHFADALGALGLTLVGRENFLGSNGTGFNGLSHIALTKTVTVADVQGSWPRSSD